MCIRDRDCRADKVNPDLLYTYTGMDAPWRGHPRTTAQYLASHDGDLEELCKVPGWCLALHRGDTMHNVFLGTGQLVLANV
eukprot:3900011-Alexandrium_andersonii.AAC.1